MRAAQRCGSGGPSFSVLGIELNSDLHKQAVRLSVLGLVLVLAACSNTSKKTVSLAPATTTETAERESLLERLTTSNEAENIGNAGQTVAALPVTSNETKFSSKAYGVKGSPRVTTSKRVRKGGGRYHVGKPYTIRGKRYYPKEDPNYKSVGLASWYGPNFHGRLTANGEIYDQFALTAAHPTMPLPSYAKVTNLENGASLTVRVNDRGPFAPNRVIDLSSRAAELLGYTNKGLAKVKVEYVGRARMDGLDEEMLVATYNPGRLDPNSIPPNAGGQVLLAQAETPRRPNIARRVLSLFETKPARAPVPVSRPSDQNGGYPIELTGIYAPRPTALINGYVSEDQNPALAALEVALSPSHGLERMKLGPISSEKVDFFAERFTDFGPVARLSSPGSSDQYLLVTFDAPDRGSVDAFLRSQGIASINQ